MRVVVVKEYTDKYTGEGHVIGEKLDMTEERFEEIQKNGMFLVDISDEVAPQSESDVQDESEVVDEQVKEDTENQETLVQNAPVEPSEQTKPEKKEKAPAKGRRIRSKKSESEGK